MRHLSEASEAPGGADSESRRPLSLAQASASPAALSRFPPFVSSFLVKI